MNQPIQHDTQAAVVSVPPDATCKVGNIDELRLSCIAEGMPISFRYNGFSHAVMMATPDHLQHFAVGFSRSLDELIGAMLRGGLRTDDGFCLITSRCSFEMVQKAAAAGFPTLMSVGAPTALAVRMAATTGVTLYSLSRDGEPLQFTSQAGLEEGAWPRHAS
jgi:formate dehydrogenase assembly factor FdhD